MKITHRDLKPENIVLQQVKDKVHFMPDFTFSRLLISLIGHRVRSAYLDVCVRETDGILGKRIGAWLPAPFTVLSLLFPRRKLYCKQQQATSAIGTCCFSVQS
jgi:serine/threonine protein kinase